MLLNDFKTLMGNDGFWIPLALAAMGAVQGSEQEKQVRKQNQAAATQTQFSPWTRMGAGQLQANNHSALGGAVQGGLGGLMMQQSLGKSGMFGGNTPAPAAGAVQQPMQAAPIQQGGGIDLSRPAAAPTLSNPNGGNQFWSALENDWKNKTAMY